jgi:hypothetical protein
LAWNLFHDEANESLVRLAIEIRNINVHNGGIVNSVFKDRVKENCEIAFVKGERHHTSWDMYVRFAGALSETASRFDDAAVAKFKLKRQMRKRASAV